MSFAQTDSQYWAFISYSSKDRKWGSWLHRRLENFPIPEEFRGSEVFDGAVLGKNLRPIFRDRDELSGSADLGTAIQSALERSHFLVVLCSKNAAQSKWVDQEIETFRALKGDANILALILDGIPNATSMAGEDDAEECFPPALRYPHEPLAGDMRKAGDGKERGFLKVVAGIAQLDFDRLYRRHERMQQRRRFWIGVGAAAIICVMAGLSAVAWQQSQVAKKERNQALRQEQRAIEERNRADAARVEADHSTSDLLLANGARSIEGGRWGDALVQLAAAWKTNPQSEEANLLLPMALRQLEGDREVIQGHPAPITLMRFAPPHGHLVTASEDGQILVRDGGGGEILHDFQDHLLAVRVATFFQRDDSGTWMATSGDDRRIHVYQLDTGELLYRNLSHLDAVLGLEFAPDGQRLLSWSVDATLVIHSWDADEVPTVIRTFDHGSIRFAAWLQDGEEILAVHHSGKITRWDAKGGTLLDEGECASTETLDEPVVCAALDPSGKWLAVGTRDQGVRFWDVEEHRMVDVLEGQASAVWDVRFATMPEPMLPGDSQLFLQVVYANGMIERWQPHLAVRVPGYHSGVALDGSRLPAATDLCVDGAFQAIGDSGGGLRMLHAPSGMVLNFADAYDGSCTSMTFDPEGLNLWTGGSDGNIRRWRMQGRRIVADPSGVQCADVHEASARLLSGGNDGAARLWDLASGEFLGEFRHAEPGTLVTAVKFSADGERVLTAGGREVRLWDAARPEEPLRTIQVEEPHWIRDAAFCQNERAVVVAVRTYLEITGQSPTTWSEGDGWRIFDLTTGEETSRRYSRYSGMDEVAAVEGGKFILWRAFEHAGSDEWSLGLRYTYESELTCFRVDQSDGYLFGTIDGGVQRFDIYGTRLWSSPRSGARMQHLAVDRADGLIAGIDHAGKISLVEHETGKLHRRITLGGRDGVATALPADSALVFGALADGRVSIWHRGNGRSLLRFAHHANRLSQMRYLADRQASVTVARDGRVWVLDCGWEADFVVNEDRVIERVWQALSVVGDIPIPYATTSALVAAFEAIPRAQEPDAPSHEEALNHFQNGDWHLAWEALEGQPQEADSPAMAMVRRTLGQRRTGLMEVSEPLPSMVARLGAGTGQHFASDFDGRVWVWKEKAPLTPLAGVPRDFLTSQFMVSPNDTRLALWGLRAEFKLCDASNGSPIFTLAGMASRVTDGCFLADGEMFYGIGYDSKMMGWSVASGEKVAEFPLPSGSVTRSLSEVEIQGRPHLLLTTYKQVFLFDVEKNEVEQIPATADGADDPPYPGWEVGITASGESVILGGNQPRIYDRISRETKGVLDTEGKEVSLVLLTENDTMVVAGTSDGWLYAFSLPGGERLAKTSLPDGGDITHLDSVDGKPWVLASSHQSGVWLCSLPDLKLLAHLKFDQVETDGVRPRARYAIARDGETVVTASTDRRIYRWNIAEAASGAGQSEVLDFDPAIAPRIAGDRVVLAGASKSNLEVRSASDGQLVKEIPLEPHERLAAMHFSVDGTRLLLDRWVKNTDEAKRDEEIREWKFIDLDDRSLDATVQFNFESLVDGFLSLPDKSGWLAVGLSGRNGAWLKATDLQGAARWGWDSGKGTSIACRELLPASDGDERVLIATTDGRCILLDAKQGDVLRESRLGGAGTHWVGAAWDASAQSLVTVNRGGTIQTWNVETGAELRTIHGVGTRPLGMRLTGGRRLLVEGDEGRAEVWDVERGTRLLSLDRDAMRTVVRCSPDGEWCLAGNRSGEVEVWHIGQGVRVGSFASLSEGIHGIQISSGGQVFLTSRDGSAKMMPFLPMDER